MTMESKSDRPMLEESIPPATVVSRRRSSLIAKLRLLNRKSGMKNGTNAITPPDGIVHTEELICYMKDSPYNIHKYAQNGNVKEVARILQSDPKRLQSRNTQGQMPIHVAALHDRVDVMQTLIEFNVDLDEQDKVGDTALHISVRRCNYDLVDLLIDKGANTEILNGSHMAPIHVASDGGDVEVIKTLLSHDLDINILGEQGQTTLHYAAAKDHGEAMRTLMSFGGKPCHKDDHGLYPIHVAAKCAAPSAMEAIIEQALDKGYTREEILTFKDRENNMPLHAAVNGGNVKAVMVCLKAGASVKVQQHDGSTPVHFASAQGNMEMISMMKTMQPDNFLSAIFTEDAMKMTPLHRASIFDHTQVMQYLLDHGSAVDSKDASGRTPLLLAASKGYFCAVKLLISKNADVYVKDKNNRNFLHLAIRFGGQLKLLGKDFMTDFKSLQNERDDFGCTPLHYASKTGHLLALDDLIRMGALISPKNNEKQSPFHFAARYGRYNTCRRLLDSMHGANIINETDGSGLTALHIAAQNGHTKVIQLLLARGAVVSKDHDSNSPLHHAAANGWTYSIKILVGVKANLIDEPNQNGDTALHVAAKGNQTSVVNLLLTLGASLAYNDDDLTFMDYVIQEKYQDVAMTSIKHDRWNEVLALCSKIYGCVFLGLIQQLPDVCMGVLDRCKMPSQDNPRSSKYHITYNFSYLEIPSGCISKVKDPKSEYTAMIALQKMVENNRVDCLSHPVCETFLKAKWSKYGCAIYAVYLFIYALFLTGLTVFIVNKNSLKHFDDVAHDNKTQKYLYGNKDGDYHYSALYKLNLTGILIYCCLNIIKEIVQMIGQKRRYFSDFQNYIEWVLYASCIMFVCPFLMGYSFHWQWESGAIAVFLAWFNCLVILQRFDFFGIYVVMFLEILHTLLQVLCVFSILIIAFGISFFLLMHNENSKAFSTPSLALLRTFMMMLELDYMVSFNEQYVDLDDKTLHFGTLTLVMLTVFVLFMPILLMNLLIGLAVGDIESVQRNARLKRMAMQVQLHADMEAKMPLFLLKRVAIFEHTEYPNNCAGKIQGFFNFISGTTMNYHVREQDPANCNNVYMYQEMYKQKVRMREMNTTLQKNNELLRKIMQKMEIHSEEDAWDEGAEEDGSGDEHKRNKVNMRFKPKYNLKSVVLSVWQQGYNT